MSPRLGSGLALTLATALLCGLAGQGDAAPTTRPVPPRVDKKTDHIHDPLDSDDDDAAWLNGGASSRPASGPAPSPTKGLTSKLRFNASALLRYALDLHHDSPRTAGSGATAGYREDVLDLTFGAWASVAARLSPKLRLVVGARLYGRLTARRPEDADERFYGFNGELRRSDFEALAGDSFLEWSPWSWLDLRAGMLTVVWGQNDLVNPNDQLSAKDLRLGLLTDAEATRLPTAALSAEMELGGFHLTGLWQPLFWSQRVDVFGSDYALFGPGAPESLAGLGALVDGLFDDSVEGQVQAALLATERPRPLRGSTLALRLARSVGGFDLAAQLVWGYQRLPVLRIRKDAALTLAPLLTRPSGPTQADLAALAGLLSPGRPTPLSLRFDRATQVGLSLSKAIWKLVVDLDVSYLSARPEALAGGGLFGLPLVDAGRDELAVAVFTPVLSYTLGLRYSVGDELLLKAEWWHEVLTDLVGADDAPELLLGDAHRGGLALLFRFLWRRIDLTGQLLIHAEMLNRSLVVSPELSYRVNEHLQVIGGANVFVGQRGPGALLDMNDQAYLALKGFL